MTYTIIDVETTGKSNKITEISIFKFDGIDITDEFTSLVNPQILIPDYITALTGIDNLMVANAPTFSEISEQIIEITKGSVFVAHNVNFDYNVIRNEFKSIDIEFRRKKLCTVRLSRKLLPGHPSYSLGKLCKNLNITITNRHRARGDAKATVILFNMLLKADIDNTVFKTFLKRSSREAVLPSKLPTSTFNTIPNAAGVYYFKDKKGKIIYIGKAKDLKKRVLSHFYSKNKKSLDMCRETKDIHFELSGSELIALLMEDAAIKQYFPKYNSQAKRIPKAYGIFSYVDRLGVSHLAYNTIKPSSNPIKIFYSVRECRAFLEALCIQYNLCPKYCHLQEGISQCSHYYIKNCKGVCQNNEPITSYNTRVHLAISSISNKSNTNIIKNIGRTTDEVSFVYVENGLYRGYGFVDTTVQINSSQELEDYLIPQKDNLDVQRLLRSYLS